MMLCVGLSACRQALGAVLDLPPPRPAAPARAATRESDPLPAADTNRPAFERTLNADSARALLPRDHAGNIDWVTAARSGVINPRRVLPGRPVPQEPGFRFGYDFRFPGPDSTFDAEFRHSIHTDWAACSQCHARLFPYRNNTIRMADVFQGRYCGACHGKVSFPVMTGCERCHQRLNLPANRAQPDLLGTLRLRRVSDSSGIAAALVTQALPPAQFPHWVHRSRYRCSACHMELFEPVNGANAITMRQISSGQACGVCHDGRTAFPATIGTCQRCHVEETAANAATP